MIELSKVISSGSNDKIHRECSVLKVMVTRSLNPYFLITPTVYTLIFKTSFFCFLFGPYKMQNLRCLPLTLLVGYKHELCMYVCVCIILDVVVLFVVLSYKIYVVM